MPQKKATLAGRSFALLSSSGFIAVWIALFWYGLAWMEYWTRSRHAPIMTTEQTLLDLRYSPQIMGDPRRPPQDVAIVAIDDDSLMALEAQYGKFPWPRYVYADLLHTFTQDGVGPDGSPVEAYRPRVVLFDVLYLESATTSVHQQILDGLTQTDEELTAFDAQLETDGGGPEAEALRGEVKTKLAEIREKIVRIREYIESLAGDDAFAEAMVEGLDANVWTILAAKFLTRADVDVYGEHGRPASPETLQVLAGSTFPAAVRAQIEQADIQPLATSEVQAPIGILAANAAMIGHSNAAPDLDGALRSTQAMLQFGTELYMPLGLSAVYLYDSQRATDLGQPTPEISLRQVSPDEYEIDVGPWYGFGYAPIDEARAREEGVDGGLEVTSVEPGSPAAAAGLRPGDILLAANGTGLRTPDDYTGLTQGDPEHAPKIASTVSLNVWRDRRNTPVPLTVGSRCIPIDTRARSALRFYGPTRSITTYSFVKVLHRELPVEDLRGKIVLIGSTATGAFDHFPTPVDAHFPGVEFHATFIANAIEGAFLAKVDLTTDRYVIPFLGGILFACVLIAMCMERLPAVAGVGVGVLLLGGYTGFCVYMFRQGVWVHMTTPLAAGTTTFVVTSIRRGLREEQARRQLRKTFQPFVSAEILNEVLSNPDAAKMGGEKREATVLFSDVAGFTAMSERLSAEDLVRLMNEYFAEMTVAITNQAGYLDKYIGDGIMAEFGVPVNRPDHPERAVRCALEMIERLEALNARWAAQGITTIGVRIGVNTGEMTIGQFGSEERHNYTAMGDAVNLGSRLEATNKEYGTTILVSDRTHDRVKDHFEMRELDRVRVPGKTIPEGIYEVMGLKGAIAAERKEAAILFSRGLEHYRTQKWDEAIETFEQALKAYPKDKPSEVFKKRCLAYLEKPPAENWDGVYDVTKK